ncbi:MAG: ELKS/Rab6-interacting/CAST family protein [Proteobacteria bacterium]|jgi:predicted  nucleic acid-binding Zn-ribbon protein|nr:ELKS/Rab6-interacting/CAST family protein [Pseudomonadota bacterium]
MFENLPSPLGQILTTVISASAIIFAISYAYAQMRSGKSKADSDTMQTLSSELGIMKEKIERLDSENVNKDKEIAKLSGKVEALSRENTDLRNTLALRDPQFAATIKTFTETLPKLISSIETLDKNAMNRYDKIMECVSK